MSRRGRLIALYGATGTGKTTLLGEYAELIKAETGKRLLLNGSDLGGFNSIIPQVDAGLVEVNEFVHGEADPWNWINDAVKGKNLSEQIGAVGFDSAQSMGEALLGFITKSDWKVGQQSTQRFTVNRGKEALTVGLNNEAHYGLVQGFMLDKIWDSTWMVRNGIDVIWTFGEWRGEDAKDAPVIGPAIVGKALTPKIPKWFQFTFRTVSIPEAGQADRHLLQITPQPEMAGSAVAMANPRWPKGIECPAFIEPASLKEFFLQWEGAIDRATASVG